MKIDRSNLKNSSFMQGLTESYFADLGRIVAAWSHVESKFDMLFLSFVVMRGESKINLKEDRVTSLMGQSFDRRIKDFRNRIEELNISSELKSGTLKTLDNCLNLRRERDEVAHSAWSPVIDENMCFNKDKGSALFKSWKSLKPYESKEVSQDRLKKLFERIHILFWDLVELSCNNELRESNT